jgi:hypothetical protein
MPITITTTLPNPDCSEVNNSVIWDQFIIDHGILTAKNPVIRRYQNLESSPAEFMDSNHLIHHLTHAVYGLQRGYATLADDEFGSDEPDSTFQPTLEALDALFETNSYRFTRDSKVFKGVNKKPYYEIFCFDQVKVGDKVTMPGFLSTSVCRDKALEFSGLKGVLLVVIGLDSVNVLVPENTCVAMTKRPNIPEQEIILDRNTTFKVESVIEAMGNCPREVTLRVLGSSSIERVNA